MHESIIITLAAHIAALAERSAELDRQGIELAAAKRRAEPGAARRYADAALAGHATAGAIDGAAYAVLTSEPRTPQEALLVLIVAACDLEDYHLMLSGAERERRREEIATAVWRAVKVLRGHVDLEGLGVAGMLDRFCPATGSAGKRLEEHAAA